MANGPRHHLIDRLWAFGFALPAILILTLCIAIPACVAIGLSLTHTSRFGSVHWAGFYNYTHLIDDPIARRSFLNTFVFALLFVPLNIAASLTVALMLRPSFKGMAIIRSVYFLPASISSIVTVSIFRFIFDRNYGPLNAVLTTIGFNAVPWLWAQPYALISIILLSLWKSTPFTAMILLAALQDVPDELQEAAAIDGAGPFRRLLVVTIPSIWPVLSSLSMLAMIGALRVFEPMFVLTEGGPAYSTRSIALHAYLSAFRDGNLGYASAVSTVLLVVIVAITVISKRLVESGQ
jgi:multiple sugar transport system permease protein